MDNNANEAATGQGTRSVADNIRQVTEASKQLLDAGKQMSDNLSELSTRVENVTNVGAQFAKNPWVLVGGAIAAGLLLIMFSGKD